MKKKYMSRISKSVVTLLLVLTMTLSPLAPTQKVEAFWDYVVDIVSVSVSAVQCFDGEGNTWIDCGLLGLDVGLAVLPFVPAGLGAAKKAATVSSGVKVGTTVLTKGDDLIDGIKGFGTAYDAIDAGYPILNSVDDIPKGKTILSRIGVLKGIGNNVADLERHHLVPEALAEVLGVHADNLTGVLITKSFHRGADNVITTPLNNLVKSLKNSGGTVSLNGDNMIKLLNGVSKVYKGNPVMQSAAIFDILKSPAGVKWLTSTSGLTATGVAKVLNVMNRGTLTNSDLEDSFKISVSALETEINRFENLPSPYRRINITGAYKEVDDILAGTVTSAKSDKISYGGHTYQVVNPSGGTTWSAQDTAKASGGYLVQISDAQEQAMITALLKSRATKNVYWMGGWFNKDANKWYWQRVTGDKAFGNGVGDPVGYNNWKPEESDRKYPVDEGQGFMGILGKPYSGRTTGVVGQWISENYSGNQQGNEFFQSENFGYIIEWNTITSDSSPWSQQGGSSSGGTTTPAQSGKTQVTNQRIGSDGDTYTGDWANGQPNGKGTYKWAKGAFAGWWYYGEFSNGKMHGSGVLHESSGATYAGVWTNDILNGNVVYTSADGTVYDGVWTNGKCVGSLVARNTVISSTPKPTPINAPASTPTPIFTPAPTAPPIETTDVPTPQYTIDSTGVNLYWPNTDPSGFYLWKTDWRTYAQNDFRGELLNNGNPVLSGSYTDYNVEGGVEYSYQLQSVSIANALNYNGYGSSVSVPVPRPVQQFDPIPTLNYDIGDGYVRLYWGATRNRIVVAKTHYSSVAQSYEAWQDLNDSNNAYQSEIYDYNVSEGETYWYYIRNLDSGETGIQTAVEIPAVTRDLPVSLPVPYSISESATTPYNSGAFTYSGASIWAVDGIEKAYRLGVIPDYMTYSYNATTTRLDFVRMAYRVIEYGSGKPIAQILYDNSIARDVDGALDLNFSDVQEERYSVAALNALGVINGKGGGKFAPYDNVTREEAAVLLSHVHQVLTYGRVLSNGWAAGGAAGAYSDSKKIAAWALSDVNSMRSLGVMSGEGNNLFNPKGNYTHEQTIATFMRLPAFTSMPSYISVP